VSLWWCGLIYICVREGGGLFDVRWEWERDRGGGSGRGRGRGVSDGFLEWCFGVWEGVWYGKEGWWGGFEWK
jgi:hypothetical protein